MNQYQQARKKQSRTAATAVPATDTAMKVEPIGDHRGYLAIGLAAVVVAIVALIVVMIILAAT